MYPNAYGVLTNAVMPCGIKTNQQYRSGPEWEAEPADELFRGYLRDRGAAPTDNLAPREGDVLGYTVDAPRVFVSTSIPTDVIATIKPCR